MKKYKLPKYLRKLDLDKELALDRTNKGRKLSCLVSCSEFIQWCKRRSSVCCVRTPHESGLSRTGRKRDFRGKALPASETSNLWCGEYATSVLCAVDSVRDGVKIQRSDYEKHKAAVDDMADSITNTIHRSAHSKINRNIRNAVDSWIKKHPKLSRISKAKSDHKCTSKACKDYFVQLHIKEWQSKDYANTHTCTSDSRGEASTCTMPNDPDIHHRMVGSEDRMYICTKYGDVHWCVDHCEFMKRELKTTISYCPISGRALVEDVEMRTVADDIVESQGRGTGPCELVRAFAIASIQHKDNANWMNVSDLKAGWIAGLVNCKTVKDIEEVRIETTPRVGRHPVSSLWLSMACDVWSLLCQERYEIQQQTVEDRIRIAKINGVRDANRVTTEHKIKMAKGEAENPYCLIGAIDIITKFYSTVRPRVQMAPLKDLQASEYVARLADRLVHMWRVISAECDSRGKEFTRNMTTFAIGSLYILSNGIIIPATSSFEAERVLLEPDKPLKDFLPSYEVTHALTKIPQKQITSMMNDVRCLIIDMAQHDPVFVSRLNDTSLFVKLE